jgi:hypothetical protein
MILFYLIVILPIIGQMLHGLGYSRSDRVRACPCGIVTDFEGITKIIGRWYVPLHRSLLQRLTSVRQAGSYLHEAFLNGTCD